LNVDAQFQAVLQDPTPPRGPSDSPLADAFAASMPEAYRLRYASTEFAQHARIVEARAGALVRVAACAPQTGADADASWICVVTDDRPGLLSLLSAAISAHSLDILAARIYCRTREGAPDEAVDFFAVRRLKGSDASIAPSDLVAIGLSIEALLIGETNVDWLERRASPTSRPAGLPATQVQFHEGAGTDVFVVESDDRPGLLLTITLALYRKGLTIVRSTVVTTHQLARDEFELLEQNGERLTDARKAEIVTAVRDALAKTRQRPGKDA
jgi:[protein-PII] uridylyltransferase